MMLLSIFIFVVILCIVKSRVESLDLSCEHDAWRCLLCRNNMFDVADWLVVADTVSLADTSLGKRYRVLQVFYHPHYNRHNNDYDVGLLRTVTDVDMTGQRRRTLHPF